MTSPGPLTVAACRTYRSLRLAVVGLVTLLLVSVVIASVHRSAVLDSLSAYYYTPVRSVFVGALVGIGAALISIRGRAGAENTMLNVAGMLSPVVALVPTPRMPPVCDPAQACRYDVIRAAVRNNMWAFAVVGAVATIITALWSVTMRHASRKSAAPSSAVSARGTTRHDVLPLSPTLMTAAALCACTIVWLVVSPGSLVAYGHYVSAIGLFGLITAVAGLNALRAADETAPPVGSTRAYRTVYWAVAGVMLAAIVATLLIWGLQSGGALDRAGWLIYLEAVLIVAFAVFWLVQTAQFWRSGVPAGAHTRR